MVYLFVTSIYYSFGCLCFFLFFLFFFFFLFLMIRRPPRSTLDRSSAASDVYKRQMKAHHSNLKTDYVESFSDQLENLHFAEEMDLIPELNEDQILLNTRINELPEQGKRCLLYTSPSPRDRTRSRMPSSA